MNKSIKNVVQILLNSYKSGRVDLLKELKDKIMGYPINGIVRGAILEEDLDMWISNEDSSIFQQQQVVVENDGQSVFELSFEPIEGSVMVKFDVNGFLTIDVEKIEGKNCHITKEYAELLNKDEIVIFMYKRIKKKND
jgi:hypothetical protein